MDIEFNKNEDHNRLQIADLHSKAANTKLGGGKTRIEAQHKKGKLTARERIDHLVDNNSELLEVGLFAGDKMYQDEGGCPSGGTIVVLGYIQERICVIVANDATVKAGAWFPITLKRICGLRK